MQHIRIIAPSYTCENPESVLEEVKLFLESHGFRVSVEDGIFAIPPIPLFANTREVRTTQLINAINDPSVDIIWAFRGGSSAAEAIPFCMNHKPTTSKILIGFSDITSLHVLFNQHYGMPSIHGPVCTSLIQYNKELIINIKELLNGKSNKLTLIPLNDAAKTHTAINGHITGGNLTVFGTMIGTDMHPNTHNKILLFEDVSDPGYKIHREFIRLEQTHLLNNISACILGTFTKSDQNLDWVLNNFIARHPEFPIFKTENVGHIDSNFPVIFGNEASIIDNVLEFSLSVGL
jgi:muramoyltetrapeptide carboxypeptidase